MASRMSSLQWFCALLLLMVPAWKAGAEVLSQRVASGLDNPIFAAAPRGDSERLFIVEKRGRIRILQHGVILPRPFLDIDSLVANQPPDDERGLLGLEFHPDYANNGFFYVNYVDHWNNQIIARYTVSGDPDSANTDSAFTMIWFHLPLGHHNANRLSFGPLDGYLYIGVGDGGYEGDPYDWAQSGESMFGKLLRIDVDCANPPCIPPDNPFADPGPPFDEIWAMGLRNPFRFSFDRANGDLYIADVGAAAWEEVNYQLGASQGGENYGWRRMEGHSCYNPPQDCNDGSLTLPVYEYGVGGNPYRCALIGGSVYRGNVIPEIAGHYFFADYCSDQIWSLRIDNGEVVDLRERTAELAPSEGAISNVVAIAEDGIGELYIIDFLDGEIYKIIPAVAAVHSPVAPIVPMRLSLGSPNPFATRIKFDMTVEKEGHLEVAVHSGLGRVVRSLLSGDVGPGAFSFGWDGNDESGDPAASGMYFLRAEFEGSELTRAMMLVR